MNQTLLGAIFIIIGLVLGIVISAIFHWARRQLAKQADLERRVSELEGCQKKRLPYATAAGIEDATAVAMDLARYINGQQFENEKLLEILRAIRGGPENYDPERPAGPRPDGLKTETQLFEEAAKRNRGER